VAWGVGRWSRPGALEGGRCGACRGRGGRAPHSSKPVGGTVLLRQIVGKSSASAHPARRAHTLMVSKRKGETDDEFRKRESEVKREKRSTDEGRAADQAACSKWSSQPSGEPGLTKGQAAARVRHR
jgi:hypothetical protein